MSSSSRECPPPPVPQAIDDRWIYRVVDGLLLHHAALAAWELGLLSALESGPLPIGDLARDLELPPLSVARMVGAGLALGLLETGVNGVALRPDVAAHLRRGGGLDAAPLFALGVDLYRQTYSYPALLEALRGGPLRSTTVPPWDAGDEAAVLRFTAAMHAHSLAAAARWTADRSLADHAVLLDLGGGAGTHAIAAVRANPRLRAVVLDLPAVCREARRHVVAAGLAHRVETRAADLWGDPFPAADLHLLSDVLHDWPEDRVDTLLAKSFRSLPAGGKLLVHEMTLARDGLGPPEVVASDLAMALVTGGRQYTAQALAGRLLRAGFTDVSWRPGLGSWTLIEGQKAAVSGGAGAAATSAET